MLKWYETSLFSSSTPKLAIGPPPTATCCWNSRIQFLGALHNKTHCRSLSLSLSFLIELSLSLSLSRALSLYLCLCVYIYRYVYIYISIYIYTSVHTCTYVFTYIYILLSLFACDSVPTPKSGRKVSFSMTTQPPKLAQGPPSPFGFRVSLEVCRVILISCY